MKVQQAEQLDTKVKLLPSTLKKIDNLQQRLELMLEVVRKELVHIKCLHENKSKRFCEQAIQKALRSKRLSDAKVQRYFREYELWQKQKLQKPRTEEEQVFVKAVEKGLKAQKEEMIYARKCAQEKLQLQVSEHLQKIESWYPPIL